MGLAKDSLHTEGEEGPEAEEAGAGLHGAGRGPQLVDLGPDTAPDVLVLVDKLKELLSGLPKNNISTLRYITRHLRRSAAMCFTGGTLYTYCPLWQNRGRFCLVQRKCVLSLPPSLHLSLSSLSLLSLLSLSFFLSPLSLSSLSLSLSLSLLSLPSLPSLPVQDCRVGAGQQDEPQ